MNRTLVRHFRDLDVYKNAITLTMRIFEISKSFPPEEKNSLTDQVRRSSRSIWANIAEGWRKRRCKAAFISKLSDAETEVTETQVWCEVARLCGHINREVFAERDDACDHITSQTVRMSDNADRWVLPEAKNAPAPKRRNADTP
jgi:four helix bundle protein